MSRSPLISGDLAKLLDDSAAPIYVLDDDRRILFCNAACAQWTALKASELIGQQCVYHTPSEAARATAVAAGLCPPPQVFSGQTETALVSCAIIEGQPVYRQGHFFPLASGRDDSAPVLVILEQNDCPPPALPPLNEAEPQALELHEQVRHFRRKMAERYRTDRLLGISPAIERVRTQIQLAAACCAGVLIIGPRGTGKIHAARAIHYAQREPGVLTHLACAVLEPNTAQAMLRTLRVRNASASSSPGTLMLEDVDCLAAEVQCELIELLRGDSLRLRAIATTTRPLAEVVADGEFSRELACLLSTIPIELPSLVERLEDLPLLAQAFLEEVNGASIKQLGRITPEALDQLAAYPWPGNIDELAALVREAHARARAVEVTLQDLSPRIHWGADAANHPARGEESIVLETFLAQVEKELITRAMHRAKGNKSKAARLLGLTRPRLYRRLIQLGMEQPDNQNTL